MRRTRYVPRPTPSIEGEPFDTGEQAWFWAVQTHDNVSRGARIAAGRSAVPRPCDARDVLMTAVRLRRRQTLSREHLDVLFRYGHRQSPPDPRLEEECGCHRTWEEALARLEDALSTKGIIAKGHRTKHEYN